MKPLVVISSGKKIRRGTVNNVSGELRFFYRDVRGAAQIDRKLFL